MKFLKDLHKKVSDKNTGESGSKCDVKLLQCPCIWIKADFCWFVGWLEGSKIRIFNEVLVGLKLSFQYLEARFFGTI